jgi:hypothetical protein
MPGDKPKKIGAGQTPVVLTKRSSTVIRAKRNSALAKDSTLAEKRGWRPLTVTVRAIERRWDRKFPLPPKTY